jgi:protein PhnA
MLINSERRGNVVKGYQANKERLDDINSFGKTIGKRAGFKCEWCGGKDDLRVWDYQPAESPSMETLALLCTDCRGWAEGRKAAPNELYSIRNALWSDVPAIAEGAAKVLAQCKEPWAREAIEESYISEDIKIMLLK